MIVSNQLYTWWMCLIDYIIDDCVKSTIYLMNVSNLLFNWWLCQINYILDDCVKSNIYLMIVSNRLYTWWLCQIDYIIDDCVKSYLYKLSSMYIFSFDCLSVSYCTYFSKLTSVCSKSVILQVMIRLNVVTRYQSYVRWIIYHECCLLF